MTKFCIMIEEIEEPNEQQALLIAIEGPDNFMTREPQSPAEAVAQALIHHLNDRDWLIGTIRPYMSGIFKDPIGDLTVMQKKRPH
jgi:hypothetical protein